MKKLLALVLAMMLVCVCIPAMAEETPEGYPEVVPGIDFGGQKIWIYDYWSSSSNNRVDDPNEEQQAQYDYRDWIMKTYNCEIEQVANGDWGGIAGNLTNFQQAPDGSLTLWTLPPDFVGGLLANEALATWNNDLIDVHDTTKWCEFDVDFMTRGDKVYGVTHGEFAEPRQCLYFNKPVLEAAGIDWESIYDMQADGTWTWDVFEEMLAKIQKDTDNDGVIDIWGMTGSNVDMYRVAVYNNGGAFFTKNEDGKIEITAGSDNVLEALDWCKRIWNTYAFQGIPDPETNQVQWDYYKQAWNDGFNGFYMYQTYGGYNDNSEMAAGPEWGCVAFPKGPHGDNYWQIASDNITVIPDVYDADTVAKLTFIYDLWASATPGYDDDDAWIGNKYNYTDDRAVEETYAMLRSHEHTAVDPVLGLGSVNDVEGQDYLWNLLGGTPAEILEAKMPSWEGLVKAFNEAAE